MGAIFYQILAVICRDLNNVCFILKDVTMLELDESRAKQEDFILQYVSRLPLDSDIIIIKALYSTMAPGDHVQRRC